MSELQSLKQQISGLLRKLEHIEAQGLKHNDVFPLSDLKSRVKSYCSDNKLTVDIFCELAMISKATLYKAFNKPSSVKLSTIETIISVLGDYDLSVRRRDAD